MSPEQKITRARAALVTNHPFFGCLALNLRMAADEKAEKMKTDGTTIFFSPAYVDSLPNRELRGVIAKLVLHCASQHMTRRQSRDEKRWNLACDYATNPQTKAAGFILPPDCVTDARFANLSAEEIYSALEREEQQKQQQQKRPGNGSGQPQSGDGEPEPFGAVKDAAPSHEPAKAQETAANWKALTAQALAVAKAANAGTIPGYLQRLAEATAAPVIDWRNQLRRFVDSTARADYSWTRPNRRFIGSGFYLPGIQPDGLQRLVAIVDTSGSITPRDLERFRAEIAAAMDDGAADALTVIFTDTRVCAVQEFQRGDSIDLKPAGGGGTDFCDVMSKLDEIAPDASAVLFLTDLFTSSFGEEPAAPVLWVATSNAPAAPYGETIRLL